MSEALTTLLLLVALVAACWLYFEVDAPNDAVAALSLIEKVNR